MNTHDSFSTLSNNALLVEVSRLAANERAATAQLIAALAEVDTRRLYLGEGYSSLFTYCTGVLHFSEHAAYGRIEAARAARRFPIILEMLEDGSLTLTSVGLLARHLTPENHRAVLEAARHKSTREVERQVAALRPLPDVAATIRKLPQPNVPVPEPQAPPDASRRGDQTATPPLPISAPGTPTTRPNVGPADTPHAVPIVKPLSPERYKVQFTVSRETHDKLRHAQDLLRHVIPNGDVAVVFDRALTMLLGHLEKQKYANTDRPRRDRPRARDTRHIPATVRRAVWKRDEGRCAFVGARGRCEERSLIEFHHLRAFADGGEASVENVELRCRAHNAYEAALLFPVDCDMVGQSGHV